MLTPIKAIASMRAGGLKPARVELSLCGEKQYAFWRHGSVASVTLPNSPEVVRSDFRPLVGCAVLLFAETRSEILRRVAAKLTEVVSTLTVFVLDEAPESCGHEWQQGLGWREVGSAR